MDPSKLDYLLLNPLSQDVLTKEAYRCWWDTWSAASEELGTGPLWSDDWTRQNEIGALFHRNECIGLSFFRWVDLSIPMYRRDSYFRAWDEADMDQLCRIGSRVCISSQFTIAQGWRRLPDFSLKDCLVALIIERFLVSEDADVCTATVRNNRGIDKLIYRNGFEPIRHGATMHGVEVDLAGFYRTSTRPRPPINELMEATVRRLRPL